jgi:hypothetical protein
MFKIMAIRDFLGAILRLKLEVGMPTTYSPLFVFSISQSRQ